VIIFGACVRCTPALYQDCGRPENCSRILVPPFGFFTTIVGEARNCPSLKEINGNTSWSFDQALYLSSLMLSRPKMALRVHSNQIGLSFAARGGYSARAMATGRIRCVECKLVVP